MTLTDVEARTLHTVLRTTCGPAGAYREFMSAVKKLSVAGISCRDCPKPGVHVSRLGGLVCDDHLVKENG